MNDVFYKNMLKYLKWEDRNRFLNNEFLLCVVAVFSEAEVYGQTVEVAEHFRIKNEGSFLILMIQLFQCLAPS